MTEIGLPLKIESLRKSYGSFEAVKGVSFAVRPGEIFGLLGPNGAGKTSIISVVVTLEKPTSGRVLVFGQDVTQNPRHTKSLIGYVPQEIINHGFFNVEEILDFYSGYFGRRKNRERNDWILQRLQLWEHRKKKVKQLSGGMKRRLLIAKALVHEPKLLLLDEPTAGVDIELRLSLWEFVQELKASGVTILLTTHYLEEAEKLCDRVAIIHQGQLRCVGETCGLIRELTMRQVQVQLKRPLANLSHPLLVSQTGQELVFRLPAVMAVGELFLDLQLDMSAVQDLKISEGRLEEAFQTVVGEGS